MRPWQAQIKPKPKPKPEIKPKPETQTQTRVLAEADGGAGAIDAPASTPAQAIDAMLPANLLLPGEIIILLLKPSPLYVLLSPVRAYAAIAALTIIVALANRALGNPLPASQIAAAGTGVLAFRALWQFLDWLGRTYVLTDQRIITVGGVLSVVVIELPLNRIQHTELLATLRERLFDLGTIAFATAGTATLETFWLMLAQPRDVHQKVLAALRRYRG